MPPLPVVPKQRNKTVSTITVITAYDYNVNVGHFDDISLVEEPAQTYTYDDEGNLKATTSTGNSDETFQYDGADLIDQTAGGYGSYHYEYKNHNMIKATNDGVSVTADYDEAGNSTGTKLQRAMGPASICRPMPRTPQRKTTPPASPTPTAEQLPCI